MSYKYKKLPDNTSWTKSSNNVFKEFRKNRRELALELMQTDALNVSPRLCVCKAGVCWRDLVRHFSTALCSLLALQCGGFESLAALWIHFGKRCPQNGTCHHCRNFLCCSRSALMQKRGFIKLGVAAGEKVVLQAWKMRQSFSSLLS